MPPAVVAFPGLSGGFNKWDSAAALKIDIEAGIEPAVKHTIGLRTGANDLDEVCCCCYSYYMA